MAPSPFSRLRIAAGRPLVRALLGNASVRRRLARKRAAPVESEVLDEELAAMMALDDLVHDSDYRGRSPGRARARMAASIPIVDGDPVDGVTAVEESVAGLRARLYRPDGLPAPSPGLVFYHGGGWVTGDLDTHDRLCRRLAQLAEARVLAVAYRLAPEHRFPAAVEDALAAFRAAVAEAPRLGLDPDRVGVAGDSAGGNLSAVVALRARGDAHPPAVAGLIYAAVDATRSFPSHTTLGSGYLLVGPMIDWYLDHYVGADPGIRRHPDLSPFHAPDVAGACRTLIYTAHFDPLRDEAEAYGRRLADAGVDVTVRRYPTLLHGFALLCGASRAAAAATDAIARDLGAALRAHPPSRRSP